MTTNPHAPALNFTAKLLGRFHVTGVFWYRFPYWAFTTLPTWTEPVIVRIFVTSFFAVLGRIRNAIASNLEPVLGPANVLTRLRRAYRTMLAFGWGMTERYRFYVAPQRVRLTVEGEEYWREAMSSGRGVVLLSAHIGSWELAPRFGASAEKRRIHIVREKEIDPRAQQFVQELMKRIGDDLVTHFAGDDPGLALELAEALQQGEIVAFQGDRPRAGGRTVTATMFGRPMPLPIGPASLARLTDVPMVPVFNFREGRYHSHLVIRPPIHVPRTAKRDADVAGAVHLFAKEIEWAIRRAPHQWFCFRQLW